MPLNCSRNTNVSTVCGPRRDQDGTNPLKNAAGPSFRNIELKQCTALLNSPSFAFITLVFTTSTIDVCVSGGQ